MHKSRHTHELIGAYLCEALDPEEARGVRDHLERCAECRADMESQSRLLSMIPRAGSALSDRERERIRWSVASTVYHGSREIARPAPFWRALRGLSVAAAVVCLFAAGVLVGVRYVGPGRSTTVLRPSGPTPGVTAPQPTSPVRRKAPVAQDGYMAGLPKTIAPPAPIRKYTPASSKRGVDRRYATNDVKRRDAAGLPRDIEVAPNSSTPREPVRTANAAMAQLPPDDCGSAALPMTGDDVRPIRLPVEGEPKTR